jgi:hypothetical protein
LNDFYFSACIATARLTIGPVDTPYTTSRISRLKPEVHMSTAPRRRSRAFVISAYLLVSLTLALSPSISAGSRTRCAALREWAAPYKGSSPTLDALSAFDRAHRIAIFNAVSPTVRATLVREQLDRWTRQPDLTDTQRSLLAEAKELLTPALYSGRDSPERQALNQLWSRAASTFPSNEASPRWFDIAPSTRRMASTAMTTNADDPPPCECNATRPWPQCTNCIFGGCETDSFGCGPFGAFACNGLCG